MITGIDHIVICRFIRFIERCRDVIAGWASRWSRAAGIPTGLVMRLIGFADGTLY